MKAININRYFLFGSFLVICLLALQYEFWYSKTGYSELKILKIENTKLAADNQKDLLRNQLLEDEGLLIVEHSKHTELSHLENYSHSKSYGGNCFSFFKLSSEDS